MLQQFFQIYLQELDQVFTVNIGEKSPSLQAEKEERSHFEIH